MQPALCRTVHRKRRVQRAAVATMQLTLSRQSASVPSIVNTTFLRERGAFLRATLVPLPLARTYPPFFGRSWE